MSQLNIFKTSNEKETQLKPSSKIQIEQSWKDELKDEFEKDYFKNLITFLKEEKQNGKIIYPPGSQIFNAFEFTPFDKVKVVILGQDPYHGIGQAHGLCFSVQDGIRPPPSLLNIYKELNKDLGIIFPATGNLSRWTMQGVLLLNATLTVQAHKPGSHQNKGWEQFTDEVIKKLSEKRKGIVFLLWGKYAQDKGSVIDAAKHYVLKSPHPSPFSADRGFFGCKHFSKTNEFLKSHGEKEIDWSL